MITIKGKPRCKYAAGLSFLIHRDTDKALSFFGYSVSATIYSKNPCSYHKARL
jgi:hypothetical protein